MSFEIGITQNDVMQMGDSGLDMLWRITHNMDILTEGGRNDESLLPMRGHG